MESSLVSSLPPAPTLQIAEVLADLMTLQKAPPQASIALLHTLDNLPTNTRHNSRPSIHATTPPKFDRLGRRISTFSPTQASRTSSTSSSRLPAIRTQHSRTSSNSSYYPLSESSIAGEENSPTSRKERPQTPQSVNGDGGSRSREGSIDESDTDLLRANRLLKYYEQRDRLRDIADVGLRIPQLRVDQVMARRAERELEEREKIAQSRYLRVSSR